MTSFDWFNQRRLHAEITDDARYTTPTEFEAVYYRHNQAALKAVTQWPEQSHDPGRFTSPSQPSSCTTNTHGQIKPSNSLHECGLPIRSVALDACE